MLPEALVAFSCFNSMGCIEASSNYFRLYPEAKEDVDLNSRRVESVLGPILIQSVGPVILFGMGKPSTFRLTKNFNLKMSTEYVILVFNKDF